MGKVWSKIVCELDNLSFLDDSKTIHDIFNELDSQYGKSSYGSRKMNRNEMYWAGYLYRWFTYTYGLTSKQAYKILPFKDVISVFEPYHTLDISQAIERILESKDVSFNEEDMIKKGANLLKIIRNKKVA